MENKNILVFVEQRRGKVQNVSLELIGKAHELAQNCQGKVLAAILGYQTKDLVKVVENAGADDVYVVDAPELKEYLTQPYFEAMTAIIKEVEPNIVFYGATSIGRDLGPRIAAYLGTGLTADCTGLEVDEAGLLAATRPTFGGKLIATIICPDHKPQMATVRPGVMSRLASPIEGQAHAEKVVKVTFTENPVKVIESVVEEKKEEGIEDAKVLVALGRGAGKEENIKDGSEIAKALGGTTACSRALVDAGTMPADKQVGQTGKTVRPNMYLAFGISGAVQHLAGMEESDTIIAVNKDPEAEIFKVANMSIIGDASKILPLVNAKIAAIKAEKETK